MTKLQKELLKQLAVPVKLPPMTGKGTEIHHHLEDGEIPVRPSAMQEPERRDSR